MQNATTSLAQHHFETERRERLNIHIGGIVQCLCFCSSSHYINPSALSMYILKQWNPLKKKTHSAHKAIKYSRDNAIHTKFDRPPNDAPVNIICLHNILVHIWSEACDKFTIFWAVDIS